MPRTGGEITRVSRAGSSRVPDAAEPQHAGPLAPAREEMRVWQDPSPAGNSTGCVQVRWQIWGFPKMLIPEHGANGLCSVAALPDYVCTYTSPSHRVINVFLRRGRGED